MGAPKLNHINTVTTNPIIEYYLKIQSGDEVVSKKVKRVYRHLVEDIILNPDSEWEYDETEASIALDFIQGHCKHTIGSYAGQPFLLELWQQAAVVAAFAIVHKIDGTRKHQEVILLVARKNGKSTFAAAIGLYLLIADGEMGPAVFAVAKFVAT